MNTYPPDYAAFFKGLTNAEVIVELQKALDQDYVQLREGAARVWEGRFAGKDPTDACCSVRISPACRDFAFAGRGALRAAAERFQISSAWGLDAVYAFDDAA
jgi:hypothetical protein